MIHSNVHFSAQIDRTAAKAYDYDRPTADWHDNRTNGRFSYSTTTTASCRNNGYETTRASW